MTLTLDRALPIIDAAGQIGIPVLLRGGSGIGKSSGLATLAAARGEHLEVVTASLSEPTDFGGLPVTHDGEVRLAPMPWVRRVLAAGRPVRVLFDELNTAPEPTQAALLRLLLERICGDTPLPEDTRFVAAINPVESSTGGWELPAPIAGRFLHLDIGVDANEWVAGMLSGWTLTPADITSLPATADQEGAALAQVTAFILARPDLLEAQPTDRTLAAGAWPSPRKWDWVARILPRVPDRDDLVVTAVEGLVGRVAADEFFTHVEELDLPDTADVLADPTGVDWAGEPADRIQAILTGVVTASRAAADAFHAGGQVFNAVRNAGHDDIAASLLKPYLAVTPAGAQPDPGLLASFAPLLRLAGKIG